MKKNKASDVHASAFLDEVIVELSRAVDAEARWRDQQQGNLARNDARRQAMVGYQAAIKVIQRRVKALQDEKDLPVGALNEDGHLLFKALVGLRAQFYGVDSGHFKLNNVVWEAAEDRDDGYRSMMEAVLNCGSGASGLIFFRQAVATVLIRDASVPYQFRGYELVDVDDGHVWLRFGTDIGDSYYPSYVFEYSPKSGKEGGQHG